MAYPRGPPPHERETRLSQRHPLSRQPLGLIPRIGRPRPTSPRAGRRPIYTPPRLAATASRSRVTTARTCTRPAPGHYTTGPITTATGRTPSPYNRRGSTSTSCARRRRRPGELVAFACASKAKRASRPPGKRERFAIRGDGSAEHSPCIARDTRKAYSTDSRPGRLRLDGSVISKIFILSIIKSGEKKMGD